MGRGPAAPSPFECESDGQRRPVSTEGLASLLDRFRLDHLDLLFADVQGAEWPLLDGARGLLADGRVRFLVVSTHHHVISGDPLTHQRCLDLLRELGAHIVTEHTVAESFSGDGLISSKLTTSVALDARPFSKSAGSREPGASMVVPIGRTLRKTSLRWNLLVQ